MLDGFNPQGRRNNWLTLATHWFATKQKSAFAQWIEAIDVNGICKLTPFGSDQNRASSVFRVVIKLSIAMHIVPNNSGAFAYSNRCSNEREYRSASLFNVTQLEWGNKPKTLKATQMLLPNVNLRRTWWLQFDSGWPVGSRKSPNAVRNAHRCHNWPLERIQHLSLILCPSRSCPPFVSLKCPPIWILLFQAKPIDWFFGQSFLFRLRSSPQRWHA